MWSAIERVAAKLMERGKLSAAEALEAIGGDATKLHPYGVGFLRWEARPISALDGSIWAWRVSMVLSGKIGLFRVTR